MNLKRSVLRFNGNKFRDYVKATPRNYSVIVMFTAMAAQRQCAICRWVTLSYEVVVPLLEYSGENQICGGSVQQS